jgi:hypothetical protein
MRPIRCGSVLIAALMTVAAPLRGADVVRTLHAELSGADLASFAVENLAGTMRISEGATPSVSVVATVHAESQALADQVRLERVPGSNGAVALRIRYPYDKVRTFRYREPGSSYDGFFSFDSGDSYSYDGHDVRVSQGHGTHLYTDLEIQVPYGELHAMFRNLLGLVDAEGLHGRLRFEVASADLKLRRLDGALELKGSSGDIKARDIRGSWSSDFSSGDIRLDGFQGDTLSMHATSGDFIVRSVQARKIVTDTTSGDVSLSDADIQEFSADASSGDIRLEAVGSRLQSVQISTSSGDVALRLPSDVGFDAEANQSSGEMRVGFTDGTAVRHRHETVGYRRGSAAVKIRVKTSSGDFSIEPV